MEANLKRIEEMEERLNQCTAATETLQAALEKTEALRESMTVLFHYYGSEAWYADREADLPSSVRAGVLSEDSVYDAITAIRDAAFHMLEQGTDILKNRI